MHSSRRVTFSMVGACTMPAVSVPLVLKHKAWLGAEPLYAAVACFDSCSAQRPRDGIMHVTFVDRARGRWAEKAI